MDTYFPKVKDILAAKHTLNGCVYNTPLSYNKNLSDHYGANIYLKREDLQVVRSYKIRGAYNKMSSLSDEERKRGIVCASAGNHAQGVAYSCAKLNIKGTIFMPVTTPKQKISQVRSFGGNTVEIVLTGDTFDTAASNALKYCKDNNMVFIHPFDDEKIIEGQGTVGVEILETADFPIDYIFIPIGGGGLISGVGALFKQKSPETKIIGVEPAGAAAMQNSILNGEVTPLKKVDKFVDGAAVKRVGDKTFAITKKMACEIAVVPEGKICTTIMEMYNLEAIVVEPAGALSISVLDQYSEFIKGKNVVCIVSGGNNDITRTEEIRERSLLYEGLKHYFIVNFPQRAGALLDFASNVLGPQDDITFFEYKKKTHRENGPAVIGIELHSPEDFHGLMERMKINGIKYEYLNDKPNLFEFII